MWKRPRTTANSAACPDRFASPVERFVRRRSQASCRSLSPAPRSPVRSGLSMAMGTARTSPGRSVLRGPSALCKTGITGTGNIKPTRKNLITSSGPIRNAMATAAIRRIAATVERGPRDYRNEGPIRVDPPAEPQMAEAGIEGSGLPAFITAPVRIPTEAHDAAPQYPSRHFLPCSPASGGGRCGQWLSSASPPQTRRQGGNGGSRAARRRRGECQ